MFIETTTSKISPSSGGAACFLVVDIGLQFHRQPKHAAPTELDDDAGGVFL